MHIVGALDAATVTLLRNALIAAGGAGTITTIQIGTDVTSIDDTVFQNETTLTSLAFKDEANSQCATIGDSAFQGCTSLTSMTLPSGLASIGVSAFEGASLTSIISIPAHVTSIGDRAFYSARPTTLTFETGGSGLTIGAAAFDSAVLSGASLTIPAHVTAIGTGAFQDAIPTTVTFSANASTSLTTSAGVQPFPSATSLSSALGLLSNFGASSGGYTTIDRTSDVTFS